MGSNTNYKFKKDFVQATSYNFGTVSGSGGFYFILYYKC